MKRNIDDYYLQWLLSTATLIGGISWTSAQITPCKKDKKKVKTLL